MKGDHFNNLLAMRMFFVKIALEGELSTVKMWKDKSFPVVHQLLCSVATTSAK